jgi:glycosyltransferase involved in cell wall biosynthesis
MKISIITVAYNSAKTIRDTIQSVAIQSYSDIEYIIIDGGSEDDTIEIVKSFENIVDQFISEPDGGIYYAMNKGLSLASGEIVGFLNSDDFLVDSNVITDIVKALDDLTVDACYGDLVYVDQIDTCKVVRYWKSQDYKNGLCSSGWMPAHPTFYVRREIYIRYGNFDTSFHLQADYEMALRLLDIYKIKTIYIPKILVRMRIGGASNLSLKNIVLGNIEASKACRKYGLRGGIGFVIRKILSRIPQFLRRP